MARTKRLFRPCVELGKPESWKHLLSGQEKHIHIDQSGEYIIAVIRGERGSARKASLADFYAQAIARMLFPKNIPRIIGVDTEYGGSGMLVYQRIHDQKNLEYSKHFYEHAKGDKWQSVWEGHVGSCENCRGHEKALDERKREIDELTTRMGNAGIVNFSPKGIHWAIGPGSNVYYVKGLRHYNIDPDKVRAHVRSLNKPALLGAIDNFLRRMEEHKPKPSWLR